MYIHTYVHMFQLVLSEIIYACFLIKRFCGYMEMSLIEHTITIYLKIFT